MAVTQPQERHIRHKKRLFNPFDEGGFLTSLNRRMMEGSYGPMGSAARSEEMWGRFSGSIQPTGERILQTRRAVSDTAPVDRQGDEQDRSSGSLHWIHKWMAKMNEVVRDVRLVDQTIEVMREEWKHIPKGAQEELEWTEKAIALTASSFEAYMSKKNGTSFTLRDNQLYYIAALTLSEGRYEFGEFELTRRGVELPTGEGKTYGFGLAAAVTHLKGQQVHIIEPNYISAQNHALQMGGFFDQFLHTQTGVTTEIPDPRAYTDIVDSHGIIRRIQTSGGEMKSFIYESSRENTRELTEEPGIRGRQKAWRAPIVYADIRAATFDYLKDHQIGEVQSSGQGDIGAVTAFVAEADALMIDQARTPYIISDEIRGPHVWDAVSRITGLDTHMRGEGWTDGLRQEITKEVIFKLWASLYEAKRKGIFKKGLAGNYLSNAQHAYVTDSAYGKALKTVRYNLVPIFSNGSGEIAEIEKARREVGRWLARNNDVLEKAMDVLLGMESRIDYLSGKQPILLDEYGFPLERHQFSGLQQVFLDLANIWEKEGYKDKVPLPDDLIRIIKETSDSVYISRQTARISIPIFLKKYGTLRYSSGSLLPAASAFLDIYEGEVLAVPRHTDIDNELDDLKENEMGMVCMDGGLATVSLVKTNEQKKQQVVARAKELQQNGRSSLIFAATIKEAREFAEMMDGAILATGEEELRTRGNLDRQTAQRADGKIIVTTWIAHRDIDLYVSPAENDAGGPECIIDGLPPGERGLWQALQRTVRGDIAGSRHIYITQEDMKDINAERILRVVDSKPARKNRLTSAYVKDQETMKKTFDTAVAGDEESQRAVLKDYLSFLKSREAWMAQHLLYSYIKDERLEQWQEIFVERLATDRYFDDVRKRRQAAAADQLPAVIEMGSRLHLVQKPAPFASDPKIQKVLADLQRYSTVIKRPDTRVLQPDTRIMRPASLLPVSLVDALRNSPYRGGKTKEDRSRTAELLARLEGQIRSPIQAQIELPTGVSEETKQLREMWQDFLLWEESTFHIIAGFDMQARQSIDNLRYTYQMCIEDALKSDLLKNE